MPAPTKENVERAVHLLNIRDMIDHRFKLEDRFYIKDILMVLVRLDIL